MIEMPNITLSLPSELHKFVKRHNEINWSEIARRAFFIQAQKLKVMDKIVKDSEFTEKDVANLDHKVKEGLMKRFTQ